MRKTITTSLLATGLVLAAVPGFAQGGSPATGAAAPRKRGGEETGASGGGRTVAARRPGARL